MANGIPTDVAEVFSAPLEQLLTALGSGIGQAQAELDRHSIEIQEAILKDPLLAQYGLEATWYQIPSTEVEVKMALSIQQQAQSSSTSQSPTSAIPPAFRPRIYIQPVNARYTNQFSFDLQAASTVKLSVVAVPPPGGATTAQPTRTEAQALALALPALFLDPAGQPRPRLTVNWNPGARAWFFVQTSESGGTVQLDALVKVDDETGAILARSGGPPAGS